MSKTKFSFQYGFSYISLLLTQSNTFSFFPPLWFESDILTSLFSQMESFEEGVLNVPCGWICGLISTFVLMSGFITWW